jgi:hypothetical protein
MSDWLLTPLKPIHFRPISRINSAIATPSLSGLDVVELWYRAIMDSGEFMVMVAAVEMPSHDGRPSLRSVASCSIRLYTAWILGGAGTGPGRECAALMSDLSVGDSFDMVCRW